MRYIMIIAGPALLLASPAFADDWDLLLTNDTGKEIKTVEIAMSGSTTWQPNKIDPDVQTASTIKAGGKTTIHFDKPGDQCKIDIKATFTDDTSTVWTGINVCDDAYATIRYRNGAPVVSAS